MKYDIINGNWDSFKDDGNQCDLVYIDPPFYTQKNYSIKSKDSEIGFDDTWESFDVYMDWLIEVISTCWDSLSPSGTIYSHNNFHINSELISRLPDNIKNKFMTNISWLRSHPHNNVKKSWGNVVDSIMVITKTNSPYFKVLYNELDSKYKENSFNNKDDVGRYSLTPITGESSRVGYDFEYNGYKPEYGWRFKEDKIKQLHKENLIHWGKNKPYKKMYLQDSKGTPIQNFWGDIPPITRTEKNKRSYPTQKPIKLLNRIITASCPEGGKVLDCFGGSGTTLLSSMENQIPSYVKIIDKSKDSTDLIEVSVNDTIHKFF